MDWLKNNLPIVTILILILSTANLVIFYYHFNINILSYLDFTEVLQMQFSAFAIGIALAVALSMFSILFGRVSRHFFSYNEGNSIDPVYIEAARKYQEAVKERKENGVSEPDPENR